MTIAHLASCSLIVSHLDLGVGCFGCKLHVCLNDIPCAGGYDGYFKGSAASAAAAASSSGIALYSNALALALFQLLCSL